MLSETLPLNKIKGGLCAHPRPLLTKREQAGDTLGFASALCSYDSGSQKEAFRGDGSQRCAEHLPWFMVCHPLIAL